MVVAIVIVVVSVGYWGCVCVCVCVCFGFLWPVSSNFWRGGVVVVSRFLCFFFPIVAGA